MSRPIREHRQLTDHVTVTRTGETAVVLVEVPTTWTLGDMTGETSTAEMLVDAIKRLMDARRQIPYEPPPLARICERCGISFEAHANHARFCSGRCRVAAHRSRVAGSGPGQRARSVTGSEAKGQTSR